MQVAICRRLDLGLYVDDTWLIDDAGPEADADIELIKQRFSLTLDEDPKHFLNMNVTVESDVRVTLSSEAYILSMVERYLPEWKSSRKIDVPATDALTKAYETAVLREETPSHELLKSYSGKVGALVYTMPCVRVDACQAIGMLARCMTFPTVELDRLADRVMIYLAQTASDGITYDGSAPGADVMTAECDSDWNVSHSTTGWVIYLANAAVAYASKRQECIASSSTEAEIIAASSCALEVKHFRALLIEMGLPQESTRQSVDNDGAVELSRDRRSCHKSRHIDRRYFKTREMEFEGEINVQRIDTKLNSSDILTKPLPPIDFHRHRARLMNLPAQDHATTATMVASGDHPLFQEAEWPFVWHIASWYVADCPNTPSGHHWAWRCGGCRHIFCKACGKSNMYVFACTCAEEP